MFITVLFIWRWTNSIILNLISCRTGIIECFAATNSCIFKECLMTLKMRHFPNYLSIYLQLTLEQHEFEMCRSTYMWIFFKKCNFTNTYF